jgi:two-component system, sensor histidine kinase PdtaS
LSFKQYKNIFAAAFLLLCTCRRLAAQDTFSRQADSLQQLIDQRNPDKIKVQLLLSLAGTYAQKFLSEDGKEGIALKVSALLAESKKISADIQYTDSMGNRLVTEAKILLQISDTVLAKIRMQEAVDIFRKQNDLSGMARVYLFWANNQADEDTSAAKANTYAQALALTRQAGNTKLEALVLKTLADFHQDKGKVKEALEELLYVLNLQKKNNDDQIHYTTDLLAHVCDLLGNYNEALKYALASLEHSRMTGDTSKIITFYQRLGFIYSDIGELEKSQFYFEEALTRCIAGAKKRSIIIYHVSLISNTLIARNRGQEALAYTLKQLNKYPPTDDNSLYAASLTYFSAYYHVQQYAMAEKYILKLLSYHSIILSSPQDKLIIYINAGNVYFQLKQIKKASYYTREALRLALSINTPAAIRDSYLQLFKIDSLKGNYIAAIRNYQQYEYIKDSLFGQVKSRQIAQLEIEYKTEQREKDFQLLTKQNQLQQTTITQGKTLRNVVIGGAALLLLLLFLALNRYQVKRRANLLLQDKQEKINQQNQSLEKLVADEKKLLVEKDGLLEEKEWLMKEIHHRVKNNLQIVMSLLNSQSAYLKDEAALQAIRESQHRVHAISLIHQKLYQSENISVISMEAYIKEVVEYLADNLDTGNRIRFTVAVQPFELDVALAVPVGLIINEAVTNSVKYAFPGNAGGAIKIAVRQPGAEGIVLEITDNGIGLPAGFDWQHTQSLGMSLMQGLAKQLDGRFSIINSNGLTVRVTFMPGKNNFVNT